MSALIVLTMGLGIGAHSLVYSVLSSTVLNPCASARRRSARGSSTSSDSNRLDDEAYTVIGVMPASFRMQSPFALAQLWTPLVEAETERGITALARLAPSATITQVNEELAALVSSDGVSGIDDRHGKGRRPVVGLLATWLPAARATRVDPAITLRDN